jgi:hypothetical protein
MDELRDLELTPEQAESLREALDREPSDTPAARLPEMSERERIDLGYVHGSHTTQHLFPRHKT